MLVLSFSIVEQREIFVDKISDLWVFVELSSGATLNNGLVGILGVTLKDLIFFTECYTAYSSKQESR